jgi:Ca2+-binding RTX toxin-like protein
MSHSRSATAPRRAFTGVSAIVPVLLFASFLTGCHPAGPGGTVTLFPDFEVAVYEQHVEGTNSQLYISSRSESEVVFRDQTGGLEAGDGCTQETPHRVVCTGSISTISVNLESGDDFLKNRTSLRLVGDGGGPGEDVVFGGSGADEHTDGDLEADTFFGGDGEDAIDYITCPAGGVNVTLDDAANDGCSLQSDNVHSDIEKVFGTPSDDVLTGNSADNDIRGAHGADVINGMGGDDVLRGDTGADVLDGGDGTDDCDVGPDGVSAVNCEVLPT